MSDHDDLPRVHAPVAPSEDIPTVPRGGGAPITEDEALQKEHVAPEGTLTVHQTETARAAERGMSPYGGLAPDRPDRATMDNAPDNTDDGGVVNNNL